MTKYFWRIWYHFASVETKTGIVKRQARIQGIPYQDIKLKLKERK